MVRLSKVLRVQLPRFIGGDRVEHLKWRKAVHTKLLSARWALGVRYAAQQQVGIRLLLYLPKTKLYKVDVDNQLKHVLDALQGALAGGGKKTPRKHKRILRNDRQVFRVVVEKRLAPRKRKAGGGWLTVYPLGR